MLGSQTCSLRDSRKHLGADFFLLMERKDKVRPSGALKYAMRTGALSLYRPADSL
jgi:hypothetical protein